MGWGLRGRLNGLARDEGSLRGRMAGGRAKSRPICGLRCLAARLVIFSEHFSFDG